MQSFICPFLMPVANRSIEISSPRLHCGRAAFYRSIIIPLARLRVMEVPLPYQCSWFCLPDRRIAARCQGNVSVEAVYLSRFMAQGCLYKERQFISRYFQLWHKKFIQNNYIVLKRQVSPNQYHSGNFPICNAICIIRYCFKSSSILPLR